MAMKIYSGVSDQYSHRVRMVLAEKTIPADIVYLANAEEASKVLADISTYNAPPLLEDRLLKLNHSRVIMEYLEERFPHPPLLPLTPPSRAENRQLMHDIDHGWCQLAEVIVRGGKSKKDQKATAQAREVLRDELSGLVPLLDERSFLCGEEFMLVDCCMAVLLWRLPVCGIDFPSTRAYRPIFQYMRRLFEREGFLRSMTDQEREMR